MNNWSFTGNLGRDADKRYTPSGDSVTAFSVAVKSGYGEKAVTTWVNCTLWGKRGDAVADYLKKGTLVGITGEAALREYQDKEGQNRASLDVRVNDLTLLGGKQERGESGSDGYAPAPATNSFDDLDDGIPFVSCSAHFDEEPSVVRRMRHYS